MTVNKSWHRYSYHGIGYHFLPYWKKQALKEDGPTHLCLDGPGLEGLLGLHDGEQPLNADAHSNTGHRPGHTHTVIS